MRGIWHLYLAARQAYANWRSFRHLKLSDAWNATAKDCLERIKARKRLP